LGEAELHKGKSFRPRTTTMGLGRERNLHGGGEDSMKCKAMKQPTASLVKAKGEEV